ncbi:MAG: aspartate/glutamate racemase family protein [Alphaproteobacteria bacterium]|nr:MAG: aspartate/glutamate racemase family protein [Alphaproteobacteria bacterium]
MVSSPPIPVGVMMLETRFQRLPGDVGHPDSYPFPVLRRVVRGARVAAVVDQGAHGLVDAFVACGEALVADGAQALTTSCGFMVLHQDALARRLPVPVATSALLLGPAIRGPVGVLTFSAPHLSPAHLHAAGLAPATPVVGLPPNGVVAAWLRGDQANPDVTALTHEVVETAASLAARLPAGATLLLECTNLPPFAAAIQAATGYAVQHIGAVVEQLAMAEWAPRGASDRR